ncbi:8062_t:CDS:2, partial [Scutellospora calospora]
KNSSHEKYIESKIIEGKLIEYNRNEFDEYDYISSGAYSEVYKVILKSTNNIYALKIINKITHTDELVNELEHMIRVESHENIIKLHGITKFEGEIDKKITRYALILEYADSGTLRDYLCKNATKIEWELKIQFAIQLVDAVKWLHNYNIIHGDLVNVAIIEILNI